MFLTKVILDRRRWDVISDLEDRDRLHKKVMKLFPRIESNEARLEMGILYRAEGNILLLQSKVKPEPAKVAGYEISFSKDVTANCSGIRKGSQYRFRLDANTSYRPWVPGAEEELDWVPGNITLETRKRVSKIGCGNYPRRAQWLERAAARSGFDLGAYFMEQLHTVKIKGDGALEATRFDGMLRVADLPLFMKALEEGIGHGKPYGLGLLSIRNA